MLEARDNLLRDNLEDLFNEEIEPAGDTESKNEPEE